MQEQLKTGNKYTKNFLMDYQLKHEPHHEFRYGFSHDSVMFIRFGTYEFWEYKGNADDEFTCVRTPEGYLENPVQATYFMDKSKRKTKAYWTRDNKETREANKWGYKPNG